MNAQELVAKVRNLPAVSQTALKLANLLGQPALSNDDVVQLLRRDNVLTAKLLRACNSSYFGLDEPVSSVDQAVLMLGHQQTLHIVLTLAFGGAMVAPLRAGSAETQELWRHSFAAANAAETIAREAIGVETDSTVAFTAGLLHDIGKLVLSQALTVDVHNEIRDRAKHGVTTAEAERAILGTDHSEIGAALLRGWHLPEEIVEAVGNHHRPVLHPQPLLSAITYLADCMAHALKSQPGLEVPAASLSLSVMEALGISKVRLDELVASARENSSKAEDFMALA